jgi:hypothetical protein
MRPSRLWTSGNRAVLLLDYARDAGLLRRIVAFVEASGAHGEAWSRFLAELRPRLGPGGDADTAPPWLLHTYDKTPLLDEFLARLPPRRRSNALACSLLSIRRTGHHPTAPSLTACLTLLRAGVRTVSCSTWAYPGRATRSCRAATIHAISTHTSEICGASSTGREGRRPLRGSCSGNMLATTSSSMTDAREAVADNPCLAVEAP